MKNPTVDDELFHVEGQSAKGRQSDGRHDEANSLLFCKYVNEPNTSDIICLLLPPNFMVRAGPNHFRIKQRRNIDKRLFTWKVL